MTRIYRKQEDNVKIAIADYSNHKYPFAPFKMEWDHVKLPINVAKKLKRMRWANSDFVWPDYHNIYATTKYHGLYLEIKKNKNEIFKKDGLLRESEQVQREFKSLRKLTSLGYKAEFTWSIDHAMKIIDDYFSGN